jgi:hypothetical protein
LNDKKQGREIFSGLGSQKGILNIAFSKRVAQMSDSFFIF